MHIPRTGGGTVNRWLRAHYGEAYHHFGVHENAVALHVPDGVVAMGGHVAAEVLDSLPRPMIPPLCITLLRHPVDRVVSMYEWTRQYAPFSDVNGTDNPYKNMSLHEFVEGLPYPRLGVCDQQVRMLSTPYFFPDPACVPSLERATARLNRHFIWGFTTELAGFLYELGADLGGWAQEGANQNTIGSVAHHKPVGSTYTLPLGMYDHIAEKNPLDMALWCWAREGDDE